MSKKIHLLWFASPTPGKQEKGYEPGTGYNWLRPQLYQDVARMCEAAKLDAILMPDGTHVQEPIEVALRKGHFLAGLDPFAVTPYMAAATSKIGLGCTISATYWKPFTVARIFATMDHLTKGRIAWNIITQTTDLQAQNYGYDHMFPHDERYDRADEFVEVAMRLWDEGWDRDAVVMDAERGVFARPGSVRPINYEGQYYKVRGPLGVLPSPQGHPVIFQAGVSPRGMRFAARHAEVVIAHKTSVADMKKYAEEVRTAVSNAGRDPYSIKVLCAMKPTLGPTVAAAEEQYARNLAAADLEVGLKQMLYLTGQDMSGFDLDKPIPWDTFEVKGVASTKVKYGAHLTLRQVCQMEAIDEVVKVVGTPGTVADFVEEAATEADIDGFTVRSSFDVDYMTEFLEGVVPALQRRGLFRTEYTGNTLREHLNEY
jgi:FMN-dependent oxidoreductase (nitrilotriacetate monooxygenase family)